MNSCSQTGTYPAEGTDITVNSAIIRQKILKVTLILDKPINHHICQSSLNNLLKNFPKIRENNATNVKIKAFFYLLLNFPIFRNWTESSVIPFKTVIKHHLNFCWILNSQKSRDDSLQNSRRSRRKKDNWFWGTTVTRGKSAIFCSFVIVLRPAMMSP